MKKPEALLGDSSVILRFSDDEALMRNEDDDLPNFDCNCLQYS